MALKLPRTIQLDPSDRFVFERAAEPGEWAVPGGFMFWDGDPARLEGKRRAAFRSGFLGLATFGWSTLAVVVAASREERDAAQGALARHLRDAHGAPSDAAAEAAAAEELAFAASLCEHPEQTLIALHRRVEDGAVRERFRTIAPGVRFSAKEAYHPFAFVALEGEADEPETVDLARLGGPGRAP